MLAYLDNHEIERDIGGIIWWGGEGVAACEREGHISISYTLELVL